MRRAIPVKIQVMWALLSASLAVACVASTLLYTRGVWLAPLDDAYIALTHARQLFLGFPFTFNGGDPPSAGAANLLYTCLLAPLAAVAGRHDAALLIGLVTLNAVLLWWSCRSIWHLAVQLLPVWMAHTVVLALMMSGPVIWGFFCGMDTGLMIALTLALWESWTSSIADRSQRWWVYPAGLSVALALTRPEGACLALVSGLWAAWTFWRQGQPSRSWQSVIVGAGALALWVLLAITLTGSALPSSSWTKTAWASPIIPASAVLADSIKYFIDTLKGLWMGAYPTVATVGLTGSIEAENEVIYAFPPAALLLFLLGILPVGSARFIAPLGGILWATGLILVSLIVPVGWHHHRDLIPLFPLFTLLSFVGMFRVAKIVQHSWRQPLLYALAGSWLVFSAVGLLKYLQLYGHGSESCQAHHRLMAERLEGFPESGDVAATDVGILKYFTNRKIVDVKGLTAPWPAAAATQGWGALYDEFKVQPKGARPRFAALHPGRKGVNVERLLEMGVLTLRFSLPHPRIPSEFALYEFHWSPPGKAPGITGWMLADELDCALQSSELAHHYRLAMRSPEGIPYSAVQIHHDSMVRQVIGDGGWVLNGSESFILKARPGQPLVVMMRTFAPRSSGISVTMNGEELDQVPIAAQPSRFQTILIAQVGADKVKERNRFRVTCNWPSAREYSSYHYWAFQPETRD